MKSTTPRTTLAVLTLLALSACNPEPFSFFVTSMAALQELSGNELGFGGDLRYGETGPGAGLHGADRICADIAEASMEGSGAKQWRAFLSVSDDGTGQPVNAIDRIGEGPWYDRIGRQVATTRSDLIVTPRIQNCDPEIVDDLPNEHGVPNEQPDPARPALDNHHTMTGSTTGGTLYPGCPQDRDYMTECRDAVATPEGCIDFCEAQPFEIGGPESTCEAQCTEQFDVDIYCAVYALSPNGQSACDDPVYPTCDDWTRSAGYDGPRVGLSWPRGGNPWWTQSWSSVFYSPGCEPGGQAFDPTAEDLNAPTVGAVGGYGGFYCFALEP